MEIRNVPHSNLYETVGRLNKYATILLYTSTALSIAISLLGHFKFMPDLKATLIGLNILLISIYFFLDSRADYLFTRAEMRRRLDWLDNSFGTNFSGKKSQNYFTNEHLSPGIYKLAVNCFENSFHSQFIISKMLPGKMIQTIVIVSIFICSSYIGNREVVRMFFELLLPAILIQKFIKTIFFSSRMTTVLDRFKSLFNDLTQSEFSDKTAEAFRDILEYESALSWASTPLNSKIFKKYLESLTAEWENLKREYQVK